ncbi:unnamed protein product, partial [Scytosiphon promiscuus]
MLSGTTNAGEPPGHQQQSTTTAAVAAPNVGNRSDAIPLALLAQHQCDVPASTGLEPKKERAVAVGTRADAEGVDRVRQCSLAVAAAAVAARRGGLSTPIPASSAGAVPRRSLPLHDEAKGHHLVGQAKDEAKTSRRSPVRQMGTGILNNVLGVWTASGLSVSDSRASKVDETVDIGAQANPSGVYPIVQPIAYLSTRQRPSSPPGKSSPHPRATGVAAGTAKPMPVR